MNAVEVLARCRQADEDIAAIESNIAWYRELATNVTPKMDPIGGGHGGGIKDQTAAYAVEIARLEGNLETRKREKDAEEVASTKLINLLPVTVRSVMHRFYVMRETLNMVASHENYSYGYTRNMKADGLKMAREINESDVRTALPDWYR